MRRLRRASVIVALSLLISAATAHAECAWVWWATHEWPLRAEPTTPISALESKAACDAALNDWLAFAKTRGATITSRVVESDPSKKEKGDILVVRCLPDTVDPRGPKGK